MFGQIIRINRASFKPAEFINNGWGFWRGPADGDGLNGMIEQDTRSLFMNRIDLSEVLLESRLKDGEMYISGEECIKRLIVAGCIRLGLRVFKTLWDNKKLIPPKFAEKTNDRDNYIFFDGQILRSPNGRRYTLCLYPYKSEWRCGQIKLSDDRYIINKSAVLAGSA